MSLKRSSTVDRGTRAKPDESAAKIDRQELWDELKKRADTNEPFSSADLARAVGAPEAAVARSLTNLAFERLVEKVDGGQFRAGPLKEVSQADFNRALAAKIDPKRQQDQVEIDRLKRNNDEMRRRLLEAVGDRDRYLALLRKHGIDPAETP
ncbi:MAG TPA: hypothetical protein VKE22_07195 [Haliangiales bacterium]|nr:hypothetical protein [Haliangiales bacterium]